MPDININELLDCPEGSTKPKDFFIFAGAGSGKTYTLVKLLKEIKNKWGYKYKRENRKIAVITYTNAATDEILRRVYFDDLFHISTIHSFVWDLISLYQTDIKKLYYEMKNQEISDLNDKQSKAKGTNTKAYLDRQSKIEKLRSKLSNLDSIRRFTYNPNGDNFDKASLNHEDVIKIGAQMLSMPRLQTIVSQLFPFILVDESQDTKNEIVDALLGLSTNANLTLGFIGDIKQRIYSDGKKNMLDVIPKEWNTPKLGKNHRSDRKIVKLGNKIGCMIDNNAQQETVSNEDGFVHIFIINVNNDKNKDDIENSVAHTMSDITGDRLWSDLKNDKILVLEHMMAARRMGFADFYDSLSHVSKYSQIFLQGNVSDMALFTKLILPLYDSIKDKDYSNEMLLIRSYSPLMNIKEGENAYSQITTCKNATEQLINMIDNNLSIREILQCVINNKLFDVQDVLAHASQMQMTNIESDIDEVLAAWIKVMDLSFSQMKGYYDYVNEKTRFATHQGVKGLQYDRVLVVIDDNEAKGFMFKYGKIFGDIPLSENDIRNETEGNETTYERTLRLLYVTCTRAVHSLALVLYTNDAATVKGTCIQNGWFDENEITIM